MSQNFFFLFSRKNWERPKVKDCQNFGAVYKFPTPSPKLHLYTLTHLKFKHNTLLTFKIGDKLQGIDRPLPYTAMQAERGWTDEAPGSKTVEASLAPLVQAASYLPVVEHFWIFCASLRILTTAVRWSGLSQIAVLDLVVDLLALETPVSGYELLF